eukprot:CAMPEP_0119395158 /NCGR_PEP_ID=MMETSP1334-20130426/132272_1 /TAXON_ID=127549 /ORGANISM="Calcidiscus leptoporus, Strain RCC1130" /LENGTH=147 /DNA_ID=CAMNT_0007418589 /DNA_START=203 /DNA_END=644 /DNA_ORIENTATION=+
MTSSRGLSVHLPRVSLSPQAQRGRACNHQTAKQSKASRKVCDSANGVRGVCRCEGLARIGHGLSVRLPVDIKERLRAHQSADVVVDGSSAHVMAIPIGAAAGPTAHIGSMQPPASKKRDASATNDAADSVRSDVDDSRRSACVLRPL